MKSSRKLIISVKIKYNRIEAMLRAAVLTCVLPISLLFWVLYTLTSEQSDDPPSPFRWFMSIIVPFILATYGYARKHLDISGCLTGALIGFILTLSSYCFISCLIIFFLTSSWATKYKKSKKITFESDAEGHSKRSWIQVICNGGVAFQIGLLYLLEHGIGEEIPINFKHDYLSSSLATSVLGAIACCNGDTWASELGTVITNGNPILITNFKRVPKGTNGGVSFSGLIASALGGLIIGLTYYITILICVDREILAISLPQWPIIVVGLFSGLFGSIIDSILGATLQFSGIDVTTKKIVEIPGDNVKHISGISFLDNNAVNLLSSLLTAFIAPKFAHYLWSCS